MNTSSNGQLAYELRFLGLFNPGRGYAFPCDATGRVDIDSLCERARTNYFYARSVVGRELHAPVTHPVRGDSSE
jgi:hypothetical protein